MTSFTVHQLQFTVEVETTIEMNRFKGAALRGAWQNHLRTLYCAERDSADPMHQQLCPVCFLLSRDTGSGADRRPYSFIPPVTDQTTFQSGDRFTFSINLFGETAQLIPYLVLAVGQMGQHQGLGKPIHPPAQRAGGSNAPNRRNKSRRRGTFRLVKIDSLGFTRNEIQPLLDEQTKMVQMPTNPINQRQIDQAIEDLMTAVKANDGCLTLNFLTPTRLIQDKQLVHTPQMEPLLARLIGRITALSRQYAGESGISKEERNHLLTLAQQITLLGDETHWWDLEGHSSRLNRAQKMGGFVGRATYQTAEPAIWQALLPWLLWGSVTQVGKNTVKGCGVYAVERVSEGD